MAEAIIENPILNSPFEEPTRHFRFDDEGITNEVVEGRRISSYFVPIPAAKKKGAMALSGAGWTQDREKENEVMNKIRREVGKWRLGGYLGVTPTTKSLLDYWRNPEREKRLFFCQIEALETAIFITEVAKKAGAAWIENELRQQNEDANPLLYRMAFKMATGSGKTVVMAMLIAWQSLNKFASPQDSRFSDAFLIVTPGITIRDRLRVLLPNDPENYYHQRDILDSEQLAQLQRAKIVITNFHVFKPRETVSAGRLTKAVLAAGGAGALTETPDQVVRRVCREFGSKRGIVVINDEAHHCYRRKPEAGEDKLKGDERKEAEKREEEARIWISGLEALKAKMGVKVVYDLSATPFFLKGSGYAEGTLFGWIVSDFSLVDAIESGIVKVPRVPVSDDSMTGGQPTFRDLWIRIADDLPKKARKSGAAGEAPKPPAKLEAAIHSLYGNYRKYYEQWESNVAARSHGRTPPVFIVVCNNTSVSKLVFDYISGWEKTLPTGEKVPTPGRLPIFNNVEDGKWTARPNTILVDSRQLESGDAMSADFKKIAAVEIEEFKADYRKRFPGRDTEDLTDEDLLREVMNTVGKPGKLGEHVKCVVSVSMLTEGWDANTVTHILGVRAFGTQLLCEQVVGRGLRRMSYVTNDQGHFEPEYAEVYGVPFSFIPAAGSTKDPPAPKAITRVKALEDRAACEITFPRLAGYRYDIPADRLEARFSEDSVLALSTADFPTKTEMAPIAGEKTTHDLEELKQRREQEVVFQLAGQVLTDYFGDAEGVDRPWLFPQLLDITKTWMELCLTCKDNAFPQMLLIARLRHDAAGLIYKAIVEAEDESKRLKPILRHYDTIGNTRWVDFDTTKPVYSTMAGKCHISHVVADTESWEQKLAQVLEDMDEVISYAKNQGLGFLIPYAIDGEERQYVPDFLVRYDDGRGAADPLNLIVEVSGEGRRDKKIKVTTAQTLWVPAVNNHGGFGRWGFIEITDPWDAANTIRAAFPPTRSRLPIRRDEIAEVCRRWRIQKLMIYGSVLREDFGLSSDVDMLVEFEPGVSYGFDFITIQQELGQVVGREVDLGQEVSKYIRDRVMAEAEVIYVSR